MHGLGRNRDLLVMALLPVRHEARQHWCGWILPTPRREAHKRRTSAASAGGIQRVSATQEGDAVRVDDPQWRLTMPDVMVKMALIIPQFRVRIPVGPTREVRIFGAAMMLQYAKRVQMCALRAWMSFAREPSARPGSCGRKAKAAVTWLRRGR